MGTGLYIRRGKVITEADTAIEWALWFQDSIDDRRIALDTVGEFTVSTVFLGSDASFGQHDEPILFETMVFVSDTLEPMDQYTRRYTSSNAAMNGHNATIEVLKEMNNE